MEAPPLAADVARSLFVDRSGDLLFCGRHGPGGNSVFIPTGLATAAPNVRSVALVDSPIGCPVVLTDDGKVFADEGVAAQVPGTVRILSTDTNTIFAATNEGDLYWWSLWPTVMGPDGSPWPPDKPTRLDKGSLGHARVLFLSTSGHSFETFAVGEDGQLASWGSGGSGLGLGAWGEQQPFVYCPARIDALDGVVIRFVAAASVMALASSATGAVYAWAEKRMEEKCGAGRLPALVQELGGTPVGAIAAGSYACFAITRAGDLYSWGDGGYGNLGHGDTENQRRPKLVEALRGVPLIAVAASAFHTIAAASNGQVYAWGEAKTGAVGLVGRTERHYRRNDNDERKSSGRARYHCHHATARPRALRAGAAVIWHMHVQQYGTYSSSGRRAASGA
jgi:alpha-tubulin suppressor-like RCC1 family protein